MIRGIKRRRVEWSDKRQFNTRCSFMDFKKTFLECSKEVQSAFMQTPFKWFAEYDYPKRDAELYAEVLNLYCPEKSSFQIAGTVLELTSDHVASMTGLDNEGEEICIKEKARLPPSLFRLKYFGKMDPNCALAKTGLKNLRERDDPETDDDMGKDDQLRLLILVLFGSFLFPHGDYALYPGLFKYVEDLPNISKYSWANLVHKLLHQGLADIVKKKRLQKPLGYLKGCTSLLTVWAFDILDIATPLSDGRFPTVGRWSYRIPVSTLLKDKQLTLRSLRPNLIKGSDTSWINTNGKQAVVVIEMQSPQSGLMVEPMNKSCVVLPRRESYGSSASERELLDMRMVTEMQSPQSGLMVEPMNKPSAVLPCRESYGTSASERELLDMKTVTEMQSPQSGLMVEPMNKPSVVLPRRESYGTSASERELLDMRMECNRYERLWLEQQRENLQLREALEMHRKEIKDLKDNIKEWEKKFDMVSCESEANIVKLVNMEAENKILRDMVLRECSQEPSSSPQHPKSETVGSDNNFHETSSPTKDGTASPEFAC